MRKSPRRLKAEADEDVYRLVDKYLDDLSGKERGVELDLWVQLRADISEFRATRLHPSKLRDSYKLNVTFIEYQPAVSGWEVIKTGYESFGELNKKLSEAPQPSLRAQLVFFSQ
jgi:hypothetical protein